MFLSLRTAKRKPCTAKRKLLRKLGWSESDPGIIRSTSVRCRVMTTCPRVPSVGMAERIFVFEGLHGQGVLLDEVVMAQEVERAVDQEQAALVRRRGAEAGGLCGDVGRRQR